MANVSKTLETALEIIENEISKLKKLSKLSKLQRSKSKSQPLDRNDVASLTEYVRSLVIARKDEREETKGESLETRTDSEIDSLALQAINYLEAHKKDETNAKKRKAKVSSKAKKGK